MKKILFIFLFCLSSLNADPQEKHNQVLDFIYHVIQENHPGIYNDQDPDFNNLSETLYKKAKEKLIKASNDSTKKEIITDFTKGFDDVHLSVNWHKAKKEHGSQEETCFTVENCTSSNDVAWVTIPTFELNASEKEEFDQLLEAMFLLRSKKYIVFDLRGNQGGNSQYGSKIINALFGKEFSDKKRLDVCKTMYVDWRASSGNLEHISSLADKYRNHKWLRGIKIGLEKSIDQQNVYYRENLKNYFNEQEESAEQKSKCQSKIVVITDGCNVSAALNFIDEVKCASDKVVLVGQETKADRLYMEVRPVPLPFEMGIFYFPIKVYRNRLRLDKQPYIPDIEYSTIQDTAALKNFVQKNIASFF